MKKPNIYERINKSGTASYCVDLKNLVTNKRDRRYFQTKKEASEFADSVDENQKRLGELAYALNAKQQLEAVDAFQRVEQVGATLTDAVNYYLRHAQPKNGKRTVNEVAEEILRSKVKTGKKPRYIKALRLAFNRFGQVFKDRLVNEVTRQQAEDWLDSQKFKPLTCRNFIRDIGILFNFAVTRGYCVENPFSEIEKPSVIEQPLGILTVSEAMIMLMAARTIEGQKTRKGTVPNLVPYIAIGLFAGLRSSELEQLDWSEVHLRKRQIEVKAAKAKTSRRRLVQISDNLHAWLEPYKQMQGPIVTNNWRDHFQKVAKIAELEKWPRNALRHSFGSYHYAMHQNANMTAAQMGHESPKMLFAHYRELVQPVEAEKYWNIAPQKGPLFKMPPATGQPASTNQAQSLSSIAQDVKELRADIAQYRDALAVSKPTIEALEEQAAA